METFLSIIVKIAFAIIFIEGFLFIRSWIKRRVKTSKEPINESATQWLSIIGKTQAISEKPVPEEEIIEEEDIESFSVPMVNTSSLVIEEPIQLNDEPSVVDLIRENDPDYDPARVYASEDSGVSFQELAMVGNYVTGTETSEEEIKQVTETLKRIRGIDMFQYLLMEAENKLRVDGISLDLYDELPND